jgi:hypothetical protein
MINKNKEKRKKHFQFFIAQGKTFFKLYKGPGSGRREGRRLREGEEKEGKGAKKKEATNRKALIIQRDWQPACSAAPQA